MNDLELKLMCLLASYEMDEPHNNLPDLNVGGEDEQHYPNVSVQQVKEWLSSPHCGDCVKLPAPCTRCFIECIAHKAKWIVSKL